MIDNFTIGQLAKVEAILLHARCLCYGKYENSQRRMLDEAISELQVFITMECGGDGGHCALTATFDAWKELKSCPKCGNKNPGRAGADF